MKGWSAKIALNVTNSSISILQNGFDQNAAQKITESILQNVKSFDVVCITSNYQLLGCAACEQEQPFLDYLQRDLETLLSEKFCLNNKKAYCTYFLSGFAAGKRYCHDWLSLCGTYSCRKK